MQYQRIVQLRPGDVVYYDSVWWDVVEVVQGTNRVAMLVSNPARERQIIERDNVESEILTQPIQVSTQDRPRIGEHGRSCSCDDCTAANAGQT